MKKTEKYIPLNSARAEAMMLLAKLKATGRYPLKGRTTSSAAPAADGPATADEPAQVPANGLRNGAGNVPKHYGNYRLLMPEANRLASLGGIQQDLMAVVEFCQLLADRAAPIVKNFAEWDAISCAAVVRYARCFSTGVRDRLHPDELSSASYELREAHAFVINMRDKHVAHSVNGLEDNEVNAQIGEHFLSSAEIESINIGQGRAIGLPKSAVPKLEQLARWLLARVAEEMTREKARLLPIVRNVPLDVLKAGGLPVAPGADVFNSIGVPRRRP